ncbi:hypothetical protein MAK_020 [Escherichia phage vB_Eco_Mak]|nr:hypothetical protein MAK_020 [Escherichia phage vB_Eco_Mak]
MEVVNENTILINRKFKTTTRFFDLNREEARIVYEALKEVFSNERLSESS